MPTRDELDKALEHEDQAIKDAAARVEQMLNDVAARGKEALDALQAKLDGKEDFSAELSTLQQTQAEIAAIAAAPLTGAIPTGQSAGATGAAGTTTIGQAEHAAIVAAGGEVVDEKMSGSASVHQITPPPPETPPEGETPSVEGEKASATETKAGAKKSKVS